MKFQEKKGGTWTFVVNKKLILEAIGAKLRDYWHQKIKDKKHLQWRRDKCSREWSDEGDQAEWTERVFFPGAINMAIPIVL